MWEFLDLESERGCSVCWPNNKIIDKYGTQNSVVNNYAENLNLKKHIEARVLTI